MIDMPNCLSQPYLASPSNFVESCYSQLHKIHSQQPVALLLPFRTEIREGEASAIVDEGKRGRRQSGCRWKGKMVPMVWNEKEGFLGNIYRLSTLKRYTQKELSRQLQNSKKEGAGAHMCFTWLPCQKPRRRGQKRSQIRGPYTIFPVDIGSFVTCTGLFEGVVHDFTWIKKLIKKQKTGVREKLSGVGFLD